jgi:hypothetical protein
MTDHTLGYFIFVYAVMEKRKKNEVTTLNEFIARMRAISQSGMSRWIVLLLPNNSIQEKIDLTYFKYEDKHISSPSPSHEVV